MIKDNLRMGIDQADRPLARGTFCRQTRCHPARLQQNRNTRSERSNSIRKKSPWTAFCVPTLVRAPIHFFTS